MVNYQNGKIYTIRSHKTDKVYVGSTTQSLSCRLAEHRHDYNRYLAEKYSYVTSFEIIKLGDAYIELVEDVPCKNKEQLLRREGELIREMNCINKCISGRSIKEYLVANKDKIRDQRKAYYVSHNEKVKSYNKQYYEANQDKMKIHNKQYRDDHKAEIKAYRDAHKAEIKAYRDAHK